jgi:anti-anti-sigma regulatory factor
MYTKPEIIALSSIYETTISSRSSISILLKKFKTSHNLNIVFDFYGIYFMSRSSAQQLMLEKKELEKNNIKISFINITPNVNKILEVAEHKLDRTILNMVVKDIQSTEELALFVSDF